MLDSIQIIRIIGTEKKLSDRLAEKCSENIDGNKMTYNGTLNNYGKIMHFLCSMHGIISYIFHNKRKLQLCFYLFSLVLKKKIYLNNNLLNI